MACGLVTHIEIRFKTAVMQTRAINFLCQNELVLLLLTRLQSQKVARLLPYKVYRVAKYAEDKQMG